jgi:hypothetical protein
MVLALDYARAVNKDGAEINWTTGALTYPGQAEAASEDIKDIRSAIKRT